jgi:hypothetical protein
MNFENRSFDQQLLVDMYNVPSKELSTEQIAQTLSVITGQTIDTLMVSKLFNGAGLDLRKRNRVAPKETVVKVKRVTKTAVVNELLNQLGFVTTPLEANEGPEDEEELTEQEQQTIDEVMRIIKL